jgi:hypothetical protein
MMGAMGGDDDTRDDGVEFLEVGRPRAQPGPDQTALRRPRWPVLLVLAVLAVAAIAALHHHDSKPIATAPRPAPSLPTAAPATPATPAVTVKELGHPLLGVTSGWELFGRGPGVVVRIQLALGRVTQTSVPDLLSSGGVSFVVGTNDAMVRPLDQVPGYVVPDGQPAGQILESITQGQNGPVFPGPRPDEIWAQAPAVTPPAFTLSAFEGLPTGVNIRIPSDMSPLSATPDGAGYLLLQRQQGLYDARPDGLHRISTGTLMAVGPTGWLVRECPSKAHCVTALIDRATMAHRVVGSALDSQPGVIAPDGRTAAVFQGGPDSPRILLLNLTTGATRPLGLPGAPSEDPGTIVWSPDSRWLLVTNAGGKVHAIDATTREVTDLADAGVAIPPITQLAVRDSANK